MKIAFFVLTVISYASSLIFGFIPFFKKNPLVSKMLSSFLFLFTGIFALIGVNATKYSVLLVCGFAFGVLGDFLLDFRGGKHFYSGVLAFTVNHLFYIYTYLFVCVPAEKFDWRLIALLLGGITVFAPLVLKINKMHFRKGEKRILLYSVLLIFSFILVFNRGAQAFFGGNIPLGLSLMGAATLFMASDISLSMVKFGDPPAKWVVKIINPLYFMAQTLFALSIVFFG